MEATAVSLTRTVLDGVLGSAGTAMANEAALLLGVRREVDFIRSELQMMQSFLRVQSSAGGCCKDTVKTCVKQVRDLACDLEDCLLDFPARLPCALAPRYNVFVADKDPPTAAEEHGHGDDEYQLSPGNGHQEIQRVVEMKQLADLVKREGSRVVWVWGMGGMGKSSLARMLYDDRALIDGFDGRAWVTVPHPLDSTDELERRLRKQLAVEPGRGCVPAWLEEKRCLIVVDDVSSREEWELILRCLGGAKSTGSRVIVTTRREDVARVCAGDTYELKPLEDEEARKLLCQKVYKNADHTMMQDMLDQANLILKRCRGLPLAIATIGGLLANRPKTSREWMNLREHLGSELEFDRDIRRVVTSSYDGLPYHLKVCFLYLSIFPENHEIRLTRLLRRWMAEGYITKPRDMSIEEVGRRYYNELISRSMIQPSKKARASMGVERCRVHGVVLQIILSKSIEENQLFIMDKHCNEVPQSKIRHMVVTRWKSNVEKMASINLSQVRSLTIFGKCPLSLISSKLRLLRVLDLEDTLELENDDLKHIGELDHLRYLETLDVQDTKVTKLPVGITKLEKLRHLVGGVNFARDLVEKTRKNKDVCNNLFDTMAGMVSMCHGFKRVEFPCSCCAGEFSVTTPDRIEKLRNLQVLGVVHIAQGSKVATNLGMLTSLRRLGVDIDVAATEEVRTNLCSSIARLVRLERLEVRSQSIEFLKGAEESPPKHLTSLRLSGLLGKLPDWMKSLNDLGKLKLLQTQLKQVDIDVIGELPNLTLLALWEESFAEGSTRFGGGTFQKLKLLYIEGLETIKTIEIEDGALPELQKLEVRKCISLDDSEVGLNLC
ncbi:hypothetical protein ACQ4PT_036004 [Festuca glaucescens]